MKTTAQSLNEELGTDLLAQLSVDDQREVDKLNDQIQTLTMENRSTLKERVRVRRRTLLQCRSTLLQQCLQRKMRSSKTHVFTDSNAISCSCRGDDSY